MNTNLREEFKQHAPLMRQCVDAAFDAAMDLSALSDAELAALLELQARLRRCREAVWYLLPELKGEDWHSISGNTIKEVLRRASTAEALMPFVDGLSGFIRDKEYGSEILEAFDRFVKDCIGRKSLSESERLALVVVFSTLAHKDLKYKTGKQFVLHLWDEMDSSLVDNIWPELPLTEALIRIEAIERYEVRSTLNVSVDTFEEIYASYMSQDAAYSTDDFLKVVSIDANDFHAAETYCPDKDLDKVINLLSSAANKQEKWQVMLAVVDLLWFIHGEEGKLLLSLPESTSRLYGKVVNSTDYAKMSDAELLALGEDCFGLMDSLEDYVDSMLFSHDNRAQEAAMKICDELARRGKPEMRHLAVKIGYASEGLPQEETDWVLGLDEIVERIMAEAVENHDCQSLSDSELYALGRLLATMQWENNLEIKDTDKLDKALERCFSELWMRYTSGSGETLALYSGIQAIYDASPAGLTGFGDILKDVQSDLVKSLLEAKKKNLALGIRALEIATASPLCKVTDDWNNRRYADTIGIDYYMEEVARWASSQNADGSWPNVGIDEALRRIKLMESDYPHSVKSVDYSMVIRKAFNHYSKQILDVDMNGILEMHPASLGTIDLFADCYFSLWNPTVTDIVPAHLCRYALPALEDDTMSQSGRWIMYRIILLAHLRQQQNMANHQVFDYTWN